MKAIITKYALCKTSIPLFVRIIDRKFHDDESMRDATGTYYSKGDWSPDWPSALCHRPSKPDARCKDSGIAQGDRET
jgi:hypothetical protein